jgi:hypothetical protein
LGKGPGIRGICARSGGSETFSRRKSRSQWRDSGHSLSRRFFNVRVFRRRPPETGSLSAKIGSLRHVRSTNPEVYSLCHRFRIEAQGEHETARRRPQSDKIVIGDFSRGRAVALDPPKHEAEPVSGWRLSPPRGPRRRRSLNNFWRQERQDGQAPDIAFGETFVGRDGIERCGLTREDRLHPSV